MEPTILIVDDDPDTRTLVSMAFKQRDFQVSTASDGVEAIKRFEEQPPTLMLLDISMPRVNGLDLLHLLQDMELLSQTKVIMLSALGYREVVQQAISAGAEDFVVKPFEFQDLIERVIKLLAPEPVPATLPADKTTSAPADEEASGPEAVPTDPEPAPVIAPATAPVSESESQSASDEPE